MVQVHIRQCFYIFYLRTEKSTLLSCSKVHAQSSGLVGVVHVRAKSFVYRFCGAKITNGFYDNNYIAVYDRYYKS